MRKWSFMFLVIGCSQPSDLCEALSSPDVGVTAGLGSNVLVVVLDDVGLDKLGAYDAHPSPALTPNLDQIACAGVSFNNAYSNPVCSPTRAAIMTGRHGSRTGIGYWIATSTANYILPLEETTIAERLTADSDYTPVALGKWHLTGYGHSNSDPALHPNEQGFTHYAGSLGNPRESSDGWDGDLGYQTWEKTTNGVNSINTNYMTSDTTDDAIAQIQSLPEPWFTYVAFNGAHEPIHAPPSGLHTGKVTERSSDLDKYNAMVEATDTELGRLLRSIPEDVLARTTLVVLSDNGTYEEGIEAPWDPLKGKNTLYEGGVNIPMIVTGPHVAQPGRASDALVHVVDVFATVLEIAGINPSATKQDIDGVSFLPVLEDPSIDSVRSLVYAEEFYPNGAPPHNYHERMLTDGEWKLIRREEGDQITEELYRLDDWLDGSDFIEAIGSDPEAARAHSTLSAALDAQVVELSFEY